MPWLHGEIDRMFVTPRKKQLVWLAVAIAIAAVGIISVEYFDNKIYAFASIFVAMVYFVIMAITNRDENRS